MKLTFIFIFSMLLAITGCVSNNTQSDADEIQGLPSDTAWVLVKRQHKTDVRNIFLSRGIRVEDDATSNSVIGISNRSIHWANAAWDVAICRFDDRNELVSVNIMRSGMFDDGKMYGDSATNVCLKLVQRFGAPEFTGHNKVMFMNANHTNASFTQDNNNATISIIWE